MKEVIAMIRPEKWLATVDAAINVGAESYIHNRVMGRGRQRGLRYMRPVNGQDDGVMQFLPKRMLTWLIPDEMTMPLVRALIAVNKADNYGDGKVFICPVEEPVVIMENEAAAVGTV